MPLRTLTPVLLSLGFLSMTAPAARAQPPSGGASEPAPPTMVPADVQKVMDGVSDLDILKALVPLKLTAEQMKKLVAVMKEAAAGMEGKRKEEIAAWRGIAADVAKSREDALNGVAVPAEVEARIVKVLDESEKRSLAARQEAIAKIYAVARDILTPEQKDLIEQQVAKMLGGKKLVPAQYRNNPNRAPKEDVQNLMLQVYIERILMYERSLTLLGKMKPTEPPATVAPASAPAAPAPPSGKP